MIFEANYLSDSIREHLSRSQISRRAKTIVTPQRPSEPLIDKVKNWLREQGFPLEFQTASAFRVAGFDALQGFYVKDQSTTSPREIDVFAKVRNFNKPYFEIGIVVECKWSRDKPWVVFTSQRTRMAEQACIAQSIGSSLGRAAMHCLASDPKLSKLEIFSCADRNGFGGRRALGKDNDQDQFYATVQSVVGKALSYVEEFDARWESGQMPGSGCLAFPLIVLEGELPARNSRSHRRFPK